jgi:hypothetical protein
MSVLSLTRFFVDVPACPCSRLRPEALHLRPRDSQSPTTSQCQTESLRHVIANGDEAPRPLQLRGPALVWKGDAKTPRAGLRPPWREVLRQPVPAAEAANSGVISHRTYDVVSNESPTTLDEVCRRQVSRRSPLVGSWVLDYRAPHASTC